MDHLLLGIVAALRWRVTLAILCAAVLAIAAVGWVPWLGGLQAIALVIAGFVAGLAWEDRAGVPLSPKQPPDQPTPRYVAVLASALGGGVWGALSSTSTGSATLGALLLTGCLLMGNRLTVARQWAATPAVVYACSASAIAAYAAALLSLGLPA